MTRSLPNRPSALADGVRDDLEPRARRSVSFALEGKGIPSTFRASRARVDSTTSSAGPEVLTHAGSAVPMSYPLRLHLYPGFPCRNVAVQLGNQGIDVLPEDHVTHAATQHAVRGVRPGYARIRGKPLFDRPRHRAREPSAISGLHQLGEQQSLVAIPDSFAVRGTGGAQAALPSSVSTDHSAHCELRGLAAA